MPNDGELVDLFAKICPDEEDPRGESEYAVLA
jgi:hypothetical protein